MINLAEQCKYDICFHLTARKEIIRNGIWTPDIFDVYQDRLAVGALTKKMTINGKSPQIRIIAFKTRFDVPFKKQKAEVRRKKITAARALCELLKRMECCRGVRFVQQVNLEHTDNTVVIDEKYIKKSKKERAYVIADGMITNLKQIPLLTRAADCAPVVVYDPVSNAVGVFHSGWRGTVKQVVPKGIVKMMDAYGSQPRDLVVAIGPYAGGSHYEVRREVLEMFINSGNYNSDEIWSFITPREKPGYYLLNHGKAIFTSLIQQGVLPQRIQVSRYSTMSDEGNALFTSERREGRSKRDYFAVVSFLR